MHKSSALALLLLTTPALAAGPDYKAVAERVVGQVAGVKEGEVVLITAPDTDQELASQLSWAIRRKKADSLTSTYREKDGRRYVDEVPAELDSLPPTASLKLLDIIQVQLGVDHTENPALFKDVPEARKLALGAASTPIADAAKKKGVRSVNIGNGLYPTDWLAKRYGMKKAELERLFWSSVDVDYAKLVVSGDAVKAALVGKQLKVTSASGTDLTVSIDKRPVVVSDGIISDADKKQGGAALQVWLPAGEVYLVPVAGSAEGKVVYPRAFVEDTELTDLTFIFKGGKVVDVQAKKGLDAFKKIYDAAPAGKEELGYLDLGINPALIAPKGSKLQSWVSAGTVSIGIGNNQWAGGTNAAPGGFAGHLNDTTVTVDGKVIVDKGVLKVGAGGAG